MVTAQERGVRVVLFVFAVVIIAAATAVGLGSFLDATTPAVQPHLVERDASLVWGCRVLLALTAAWIAIGAVATRTSLVRRPGAAAARATWLSATRPWRARESMLGLLPLDRVLLFTVPAGLILLTRLVQGSFDGIGSAVVQITAAATFTAVMTILVRPRSPWPVVAAVGGVIVLFAAAELLAYSVVGPYAFWVWLWQSPLILRVIVLTALFGIIGWAVVAAGGAASSQVGPRRATGAALGASGAVFLVISGLALIAGAGATEAAWYDALITVVVPTAVVWGTAVVSLIATVVGIVIARTGEGAQNAAAEV